MLVLAGDHFVSAFTTKSSNSGTKTLVLTHHSLCAEDELTEINNKPKILCSKLLR